MANVFITGTSSGIGEDAALRLDRLGHTVFAGVRRIEDGEALAARASSGLTPVVCDVADETSIAAALEIIDAAVGSEGLQGIVNNAGVARAGPLEHLPVDEWRSQFEVNVFGQVAVTRGAIPMIRRGNGRICFVGSVSGRMGSPLMGPYSGSKFAIEGIAQSLREELRPWDIEVSVVEPGPIKTAIWAKGHAYASEMEARLGPEAMDQYRDQIEGAVKGIDNNERIGASTSKTSDAIEHALFASRPKHRYLVGTPAKLAGPLTRLLPDKALGALMRLMGP
ncbi:SDR family oxidoreductase [Actinospongicola halichondriae]|uniref:SDR family oxidoreductase n=1 Tax=Actinospongicola halichondriae TaxID=3236844 RepID=UPI003D42749B